MCLLRVINLWRHITTSFFKKTSMSHHLFCCCFINIFSSQMLQTFHGNFVFFCCCCLWTNGRIQRKTQQQQKRKTENINLFIVQIFFCFLLHPFIFWNWNETVLDKGWWKCGGGGPKIGKITFFFYYLLCAWKWKFLPQDNFIWFFIHFLRIWWEFIFIFIFNFDAPESFWLWNEL